MITDIYFRLAFSHPLERSANGPADLCNEKPAAAGSEKGPTEWEGPME